MHKSIFHLITSLGVGGAENHLLALCKGLKKRGFEITVGYLKGGGELREEFESSGIKVYFFDLRSLLMAPFVLYKLIKFLRVNKFSIVHTHLLKADTFGALAGKLARSPFVVSSKHNDEIHLRKKWVSIIHRIITNNFVSEVIAISDHVKTYFAEYGGIKRVNRIYYGIDAARFRRISKNHIEKFKNENLFTKNDILFVVIARFDAQKGYPYLFSAFQRLVKEKANCKLVIVGGGDLDTTNEYRKKVESLGLDSVIRFMGVRRDIPLVLNAADVLVLPSLWEGFGLVLLEAMAAGKPVVASRVSAIPEIVVDGITGLLTNPADPEDLYLKMRRLADSEELRNRLGKAAHIRVLNRFKLEDMVEETADLYLRLGAAYE